jgi:transposase
VTWSKIVGVLKRLDSRLSDAVYLHGAVIILKTRVELIRKNPQTPLASTSRIIADRWTEIVPLLGSELINPSSLTIR